MAKSGSQETAVWYLVGATFVFASTTLFFPDAEPWLRITVVVIGVILVIAGGFQLGAEIQRRKRPPE